MSVRLQHTLRPPSGCPPAKLHVPKLYEDLSHLLENNLLDRLVEIRHRRGPPEVAKDNISLCANLAPAGTGTTTLHTLLSRLSPRLAHHSHAATPRQFWKRAKCFVMTLRDPAERLVTAFRFEISVSHGGSSLLLRRHWWFPQHWVHSFMSGESTTWQQYNFSLPGNLHWTRSRRAGAEPNILRLGNAFLVPQVAYLFDLLADDTPSSLVDHVHFICTDHFARDWRRFLSRFGVEAHDQSSNQTTVLHANQRSNPRLREWFAQFLVDSNQTQERDYLRDCMYRLDTLLYRRICLQ